MKALKTVVTVVAVVAAVALVASGVGAPIGAGILGMTWATIATAAGLAAAAINVISAPKVKGQSAIGSATDWRADPQAGAPMVLGRSFFGGNIIARDTFGASNAILASVIVWSLGPVHALESFTVERDPITFSGSAATGTYSGFMWLSSQLGATPESAALAPTQGTLPGWGASSKLSGLAASMLELKFDKNGKVFATGFPQIGMVVQGLLCYDPRQDSTYPGGSGACRSNNPATWVYSTNPFIQAITYAIGWTQNGKRVAGIGWPVASIDLARFVEGANVADANGWAGGGVASTLDDKWNMLKALLQAGGGTPIRLGGLLSCDFQTPRTSLATITAADIAGDAKVVATQPRRDRFNTAVPRFRSEAHGWEVISADPVSVSSYITADGATRTKEIDYPFVQDVDQAAQLANYDILQSREFGPITLQLKPKWIGYKPGDAVTVTIAELGLSGQKCVISKRTLDPTSGVVTLELRSETDSKHSYALGQSGTAPPTPTLTPSGDPFVVTTAADLGIAANAGTGYTTRVGSSAALVYEFTSSTDGWAAYSGLSSFSASSGILSVVSSGVDPNFERSVSIAGASYPKLRARLRCLTQDATWDGTIFYQTAGHGYSASYYKTIPQPPGWASGDWLVAEWDLTALTAGGSDWTASTITALRMDLAAQAVTVEVDWIALGDFTDLSVVKGVEDNAEVQADTTGRDVIWIKTDSSGAALSGQLPRSETYSLRERGDVLSSGVTWSIINSPSGITASISGTGQGQLDISALAADDVEVRLKAARAGREDRFYTVAVKKDKAPPPTAGGGSGGTGGTTASDTVNTSTASTTATVLSSELVIDLGSTGNVSMVADITAMPENIAPNGTWTVSVRFQRWNGSAWVDVGAGYGTDVSSRANDPELGGHLATPAYPGLSDTYSGTPSATGQKFRLVGFISAARTHYFNGTISVTGS